LVRADNNPVAVAHSRALLIGGAPPPGLIDSADWQPEAPPGGSDQAKDNFIAAAVAPVR
jgi:hypothetical protein